MMSKDSWQKHFAEQARSGKSVEVYCKAHGLKKSNYYYWQKKLAATASHPVTTLAPPRPSHPVTIEVGGIKIEIKGKRDAKTVAKLIATLLEA